MFNSECYYCLAVSLKNTFHFNLFKVCSGLASSEGNAFKMFYRVLLVNMVIQGTWVG